MPARTTLRRDRAAVRATRRRLVAAAAVLLAAAAVAGTSGAAVGPHVAGVGRYVALGNSYSSGDGAFNPLGNAEYIHATNIPHVDECHRSRNAFPMLLAATTKLGVTSITFSACAEARVANFIKPFPANGDWGEGAQLSAIAPATRPDGKVGLVTLTVGGTDVDLYPDILTCVHPAGKVAKSCESSVDVRLTAGLGLLTTGGRVQFNLLKPDLWTICPTCNPRAANVVNVPSLAQLYRDVALRAPRAKILVVGYPELVPSPAQSSCVVGTYTRGTGRPVHYVLDPASMALLTKVVFQLNQTIREQVNLAHASGVNVAFVSTYSAFKGHGPCDSKSGTLRFLNPVTWSGPTQKDVSPESFHPNAAGQARFAQLIVAQL